MRATLRLLVVAGLLAVLAPLSPQPASAEPVPPRLDVAKALAALATQQVYVAPGSVARIDMAAVRAVLAPDTRLLIAPYAQGYQRDDDKDIDEHLDKVYEPLRDWTEAHRLHLITVEGIEAGLDGEVDATPSTLGELREQTAYLDVTGPVLALIAYRRDHDADAAYPKYKVAKPTAAQVRELVAHLRASPIYNDPARTEDRVVFDAADSAALHKVFGDKIRIAALPVLPRGSTFVDYAPALTKAFPGQAVMVAQGRWLEVAGPDQRELTSARDYAFGRYEHSYFEQGVPIANRIGTVATRVYVLQQHKPFGRPQPALVKPRPFDVRRAISDATPWALLGSAIVLTGTGMIFRRTRAAHAAAAEKAALHRESARAFATIGELGAKILGTEEGGATVNPAVAERHDTARTLYDQAHTAKAMGEVAKIADEGLALPIEADA